MFRELVVGLTFHITKLRACLSDSMKLEHCARPLGEGGTEISYVVQTKPLEKALCLYKKETEKREVRPLPWPFSNTVTFRFLNKPQVGQNQWISAKTFLDICL